MDLNFTEFSKGQAWFILPSAFEEMFARLSRDANAEALQAAAASFGRSQQPDLYSMRDGVAVIDINGPISKRMSFMSFFFGGTSYAFIRRAMHDAIEDPAVDAIVLRIDSPGGVVNGVEETGDLIFNSRGQKPIIAFNDGRMMSAAYWLGSAADQVITGKTADAGSIGILMVHMDWSKFNEDMGIKYTYLTAGKYKALGNPDEPLSDLAKEKFQAELDYLYSIFVGTVARNRDVEEEQVLKSMADGRVFIGQQAVDAGLIDKVSDFESTLSLARDMAGVNSNSRRVKAMKIETIEQLRTEYPDLVKAIEDQAKTGIDIESAKKQSATAERDRMIGIAKIQFGDEEGEKFRAVVDSGVTVEQFQAVQEVTAKKAESTQSAEAKSIQDAKNETLEAIQKAGADNPGVGGEGGAKAGYMEEVAKYQEQHKCSKFEAMQAINAKNPQLRQDYLKKVNAGA